MKKLLLIILCLLAKAAMAQVPDVNGIIYVNIAKTNGTGNSWNSPTKELADALKATKTLNTATPGTVKQIWVAKGTYKPMYSPQNGINYGTNQGRDNTFLMVNNVKLYGGFDPDNNITNITHSRILPDKNGGTGAGTILSGDLDGNDTYDAIGGKITGGTNANNAYHVIVATSTTEAVNIYLDGFEIKGGNANGSGGLTINGLNAHRYSGGGIFSASSSWSSTVILTNSSLSANTVSSSSSSALGGGIYSASSSSSTVILTNSSLSANIASSSSAAAAAGAGIYSFSTSSSTVSLTNSSLNDNTASSSSSVLGGGIYSATSTSSSAAASIVRLLNSSLSANTASSSANALGGGIYSSSFSNAVNLINSTMAGNKGASFIHFINGAKTFKAHNSLVYGNALSATDAANSTLFGSPTKDIKNSLVQGETTSPYTDAVNKNLATTTDPLFTNATTGDYTLKPGSPAIDGGNNSLYTGTLATDKDLAGNNRLMDANIDLGAYEFQPAPITPTAGILYVNKNVATTSDQSGNSWANAIPELADALKWANDNKTANAAAWTSTPLQIWVAKGTYKPMYSPEDGVNYGTNQNRDNTFLMVNNVKLFGGFVGTETTTADRILSINGIGNGTILSGDLDGNDTYDTITGKITVGATNNAYHVVVAAGNTTAVNTFIDGFEIKGGNADGSAAITVNGRSIDRYNGGGIYSNSSVTASVNITNSSVSANTAYSSTSAYGGGIYSYSTTFSTVSLINSSLSDNTASSANLAFGGGISCSSTSSTSTVSLTNSSLSANTASSYSAASSSFGGGIYTFSSSSNAINLINSTMSGNKGNNFIYFSGGTKIFKAHNSLVYGNALSATDAANSTLFGSPTKDIKNSLVQGEAANAANGVLDGSPTSVISTTNLFNNFTNGDYTLKTGSAAINTGSNALYTTAGGNIAIDLDLAGNPRLVDLTIDLGAYENQTITTLPVNFDKFTANLQSNRVKLDWNTFSETNNASFIIYRSVDGVNYTEIAQQASKGSNANNYTTFDNNPANGVNYYRLSQKDNDGTVTKLADAVVNFSLANAEVKAWPNPVAKMLNLSFTAGKYHSFRLVAISGRKLLESNIASTQSKIEIEMSAYPKGIYVVELKGNQGSHLVKVIK